MKVQIHIKSRAGQDFYYPACEKAELLLSFGKNKTFSVSDLDRIKRLGFEIEIVDLKPFKNNMR